MRSFYPIVLFVIMSCMKIGCNGIPNDGVDYTGNASHYVLTIENFTNLISDEIIELAGPAKLTEMYENKFAVLDIISNKIIIFDHNGVKQFSFGSTGDGPGEWTISGPVNLDFYESQFIVSDSNRFKVYLYQDDGTFINEVEIDKSFRYSEKLLISPHEILISSNGYGNSLAVILDLNEDNKIVRKFGKAQHSDIRVRNLESIRRSLSNGEVPEGLMNESIISNNSGINYNCWGVSYYQAYNLVSRNRKNSVSLTPLCEARNCLILALNDSAEAFVDRLSK